MTKKEVKKDEEREKYESPQLLFSTVVIIRGNYEGQAGDVGLKVDLSLQSEVSTWFYNGDFSVERELQLMVGQLCS